MLIPNYNPRFNSYFGVSTCSVARVVVGFVDPNLVGVDRGGGITPLLHLDRAVPLLDPDLNKVSVFKCRLCIDSSLYSFGITKHAFLALYSHHKNHTLANPNKRDIFFPGP